MQPRDHVGGVVNRQGGLGDKAQRRRIGGFKCINVSDGFHQRHRTRRQLPHGADDLGMPLVANQHDMPAQPLVPHGLLVHLGDQRTCGIKIKQVARRSISRHGLRNAMGREDHRLGMMLGRDLVDLLDKHSPKRLQTLHHIAIVHDFMADIDRRAIFLQSQHDDLNRPVDARAKSARTAKPDSQGRSDHWYIHY